MNGKTVKRVLLSIFVLFCALLLAATLWFCAAYQSSHTFTTEKWIASPNDRWLMVDDLLSDVTLVGMTEDEVLELLGENDNDQQTYRVTETQFVYRLGIPEGFLVYAMDDEWLLLDFQDGVVSGYSTYET